MQKLTENITAIFAEEGIAWLANIPELLSQLADYWQLADIVPVENMTFNYVAKAINMAKQPVIIKLSCDLTTHREERYALAYFAGNAAIKLVDFCEERHALLLQQAVPGTTLKSLYPARLTYVIESYINTVQQLHAKPLPAHYNYRHISEWLTVFQKNPSSEIPDQLLTLANDLKNNLLATIKQPIFLHGDLHLDNLIKNNEQWLAIDPKGIIGETEFEVAAFDFILKNEMRNPLEIKALFIARVNLLAQCGQLAQQRIIDWVFVRLILMAAWSIQDNIQPKQALDLAVIVKDMTSLGN